MVTNIFLTLLIVLSFITRAVSQCSFGVFSSSPPKERKAGRYREFNQLNGHPYTLFDKTKAGWTLQGDITLIRQKIHDIPEYAEIYEGIFVTTNQSINSQTIGGKDEVYTGTLGAWAKANAFCYLIGLDETGEQLYWYPAREFDL